MVSRAECVKSQKHSKRLRELYTYGALTGEYPWGSIAGRFGPYPGVELLPAGLVNGAANAPNEREQEQCLDVGHQRLAGLVSTEK